MQTTTTLYYTEGSSDKVYQASIVRDPTATTEGFDKLSEKLCGNLAAKIYLVTFAFGRRGSTLTTGSKTPSAVTLAEAQKIHAKLIKDKKAKGYTEAPDGTPAPAMIGTVNPYPNTPPKPANLPMLLNSVNESEAQDCLRLDRWLAQEKHDGKRMTLHSDGFTVTAFNKRGLPCGLPQAVVDAVLGLPDACVLDGECVGEVFHVFDLLQDGSLDLRSCAYHARIVRLEAFILDDAAHSPAALQVVYTARTTTEKTALLRNLRARNAEGIVFKDLLAPWRSGRPNSGGTALKFKFVETASCLTGTAHPTKRSVPLILLKGSVKEQVHVGNVTIPPNHAIPAPSTIVEVRYLYAFPGGSLFQPVYLGPRDDVAAEECTLSQLKLKAA